MIIIFYGLYLKLIPSSSRMFIIIFLLLGKILMLKIYSIDTFILQNLLVFWKLFFGIFCLLLKILWQEAATCLKNVICMVLTLMLVIIFFLIVGLRDSYGIGFVLYFKYKSLMILITFLICVTMDDVNNVKKMCL